MKINTPSWMGDLGNKIGSCCLKDLTIPGSHDSGTYGMVLPGCAAHYANVYEQLRAGARYLDLRAMWNDNDYHMYHGNFTSLNKLSSVLDQIQQFLKENKNEVLILDFRLYPRKDKEELQERRDVWRDLNRRFAGQLVTRDLLRKVTAYDDARPSEWKQFHPGWLTFNDLWSSKQQILALTNDAVSAPLSYGAYEGETYIFPGSVDVLISFSADTNNPNVLLDSLDKNVSLVRNEPDPRLSYLGTQMTPKEVDFARIVIDPIAASEGILHNLARMSTPLILERLANSWRGKRLNIVAGDYINEFGFCEAVIKHNRVARD